LRIDVIRRLDPDGCAHHTGGNARAVDLNRNLPTRMHAALLAAASSQ
jgi:murein tripeptide amidase MpaA